MNLADNIPRGKIVPSESPDFLLFTSTKKAIGIEFTRLTLQNQKEKLPYGKVETINLFFKLLFAIINKKSDLFQRYITNPQLFAIWLIIVCDKGLFANVHRKLRVFDQNLSHPFTRIDLLFPDDEKVFRL